MNRKQQLTEQAKAKPGRGWGIIESCGTEDGHYPVRRAQDGDPLLQVVKLEYHGQDDYRLPEAYALTGWELVERIK